MSYRSATRYRRVVTIAGRSDQSKPTPITIQRESKMENPFMARAIALAVENVKSGSGGPFAAVIVRGDEIIGEGTNIVTLSNDPTAHAEITAIRNACSKIQNFQLNGCSIYTTC